MAVIVKSDSGLCACVIVYYAVPDTATALAVGPIKPIIGQARSESGLVCIAFYT